MVEKYYDCPHCLAKKVIAKKGDKETKYCCEDCGQEYEKQEWEDMCNYLHDELESQYDETEMGEIWDKFD